MSKIDNELEQRINSMNDTERYVVLEVAPQMRFAGNWGFLHKGEENAKLKDELLKKQEKQIEVQRVNNGYIFTVDNNYLMKTVKSLIPDMIDDTYIAKAKERKDKELKSFVSFLRGLDRGKDSKFVKRDSVGNKYITLGLYCTNTVNMIRYKGREYKAFSLTFLEAMIGLREHGAELMDTLYIMGKSKDCYVKGTLREMLSDAENRQEVFNAMEIPSTKTGVFIRLYFGEEK